MKLVYQVEDRPSFGKTVVFAIQQLLAIMAATLVVPVVINNNADVIAVVTEDGIAEMGSHAELMQNDGAYAALYRLYE